MVEIYNDMDVSESSVVSICLVNTEYTRQQDFKNNFPDKTVTYSKVFVNCGLRGILESKKRLIAICTDSTQLFDYLNWNGSRHKRYVKYELCTNTYDGSCTYELMNNSKMTNKINCIGKGVTYCFNLKTVTRISCGHLEP